MSHPFALVDTSADVLVSRHQTIADAVKGEREYTALARRLMPRACPRMEIRRDGLRVTQEEYLAAWNAVNAIR